MLLVDYSQKKPIKEKARKRLALDYGLCSLLYSIFGFGKRKRKAGGCPMDLCSSQPNFRFTSSKAFTGN